MTGRRLRVPVEYAGRRHRRPSSGQSLAAALVCLGLAGAVLAAWGWL